MAGYKTLKNGMEFTNFVNYNLLQFLLISWKNLSQKKIVQMGEFKMEMKQAFVEVRVFP